MRLQPLLDGIGRGSLKASAAQPRAVEKSSPSSGLGSRSRDTERRPDKPPPRLQVELVCQDGTAGFDPFWDGPRLRPAFVTQLLGQILPPPRESAPASARTVYQAVPQMRGRLLDRQS